MVLYDNDKEKKSEIEFKEKEVTIKIFENDKHMRDVTFERIQGPNRRLSISSPTPLAQHEKDDPFGLVDVPSDVIEDMALALKSPLNKDCTLTNRNDSSGSIVAKEVVIEARIKAYLKAFPGATVEDTWKYAKKLLNSKQESVTNRIEVDAVGIVSYQRNEELYNTQKKEAQHDRTGNIEKNMDRGRKIQLMRKNVLASKNHRAIKFKNRVLV